MDIEKHLENKTTLPSHITTSSSCSSRSTASTTTSTTTTPYILNGEFYEILSQKGEGVTVRCRKCPGENIYRGSVKSTGNFHMHIKRKHSELLPRVHEMKLKSFTERKIKMPQRRAQYTNNRKIIRSGRYNTDLYDTQTEPIDYRKNRTIIDNDMIITKGHNPIHNLLSNSYPINSTKQSVQNKYLFSQQQQIPPPAHQNSFEYIKRENTFVVRHENKDEKSQTFNKTYQKCNQIIMDSNNTTIVNNSHISNQLPHQPLQIISTPTPLITTANQIPGHDVLLRVENHLKGIECEMRLRNQIESNRFFLDLAKFKFLNPNFSLQH